MTDETINVRQERIERLLNELRYEIERGVVERDIGEDMSFRFIVGISNKIPDGIVFCEFRMRPTHRHEVVGPDVYERIRLVK